MISASGVPPARGNDAVTHQQQHAQDDHHDQHDQHDQHGQHDHHDRHAGQRAVRSRRTLAAAVLLLSAGLIGCSAQANLDTPRQGDDSTAFLERFETYADGASPQQWTGSGTHWDLAVTGERASSGGQSLRIRESSNAATRQGEQPTLSIDATPFRGYAVRVSFRSSSPTPPLAIANVRRPGHRLGFGGAVPGGEPDSTRWRTSLLELGVAEDATSILLAVQPSTRGETLYLDDVIVERSALLSERPYELRFASAAECSSDIAQAFAIHSPSLSGFHGREVTMHAAIMVPPGVKPAELPICYLVHGFGGNHISAWRRGRQLRSMLLDHPERACIYVYLDASCETGHHCFADSANNGPWGRALTTELIPKIERELGGVRPEHQRFVAGHSSGGWTALWLQVTYPDVFGGCWATAPDPIDFRDFSGVNLYEERSMYIDGAGRARPLVVRGDEVVETFEQYVRGEEAIALIGGQIASFDAVFSPRGQNGSPVPFFDRATGVIDRTVIEAWKQYDIGLTLRTRWTELGPKLRGKLHVWCGEADTFQLDGAVRLLQQDLAALDADADVLLVPGRDHGTLFEPHPTYWPGGMLDRMTREIAATAAERAATPIR